ncbi:MAG: FAD-dependent oxidoreductase, partial [Oscillospiraceae bacterium]|nr:FAD-dependent oxidoreductase [Oscillospiraceae bacterium]
MHINVIGGGLAGCEAAWQIARRGIKVRLIEMKPVRFSPAHSDKNLCELVCSNSLKGNGLDNACGLLKEEMRR